jgi:hypothetical protein
MIIWNEDGVALVQDRRGDWVPLYLETQVNNEHEILLAAETREDELRKRAIRRVRYKED